MKVSIITVTYNSANTLADTIESIISQDYPDIEYIVVDGCSTDGTLDIISRYEPHITKYISEPDKGIYDAMNKGIQMATGEVVGILNSDDFFAREDAVSLIAREFKKDKSLDAVYGNLYYVDGEDTDKVIRFWKSKEFSPRAFFHGWHPAHPTFYVKKDIYEKYGLYDLRFPLSADFELMLRFFECCRIRTHFIDTVLVKMRIGGTTSKNILPILRGIGQCKRAFRVNGLRPPLLYPAYRLLPKLFQFVTYPKK